MWRESTKAVQTHFKNEVSGTQRRPQEGARRCTYTPLDFAFQVLAEHYSCTESDTDTVRLFSTELNTTTDVGVPQVDSDTICPSTLD